ncbi:MAG: hypothetical protein ACI8W8_002047 [Rhodothermales bacterium]|jgi:hypothetical protein
MNQDEEFPQGEQPDDVMDHLERVSGKRVFRNCWLSLDLYSFIWTWSRTKTINEYHDRKIPSWYRPALIASIFAIIFVMVMLVFANVESNQTTAAVLSGILFRGIIPLSIVVGIR